MKTIADRYLPFPQILHPHPRPEKRFLVAIQDGSPVRRTLAGISESAASRMKLPSAYDQFEIGALNMAAVLTVPQSILLRADEVIE